MSYGYQGAAPPAYARVARRSAPAPVHAVALMQYVSGIFLLVIAALMAAFAMGSPGLVAALDMASETREPLRAGGLVGAVGFGLLGLTVLLLGRKLQRGRRWARGLVVSACLLTIATTVFNGTLGDADSSPVFGLALPVVVLVLLYTPAARSWFRFHTY